jgi:FAD:protein FMN transferase
VTALLPNADFTALGTGVRVVTVDADALDAAHRIAHDEIQRIDAACSRFSADSELVGLNRSAGSWVTVSPTLARALRIALDASHTTDGAVDPTIGRSMQLVGYDRTFQELESHRPASWVARSIPAPGIHEIALDDRVCAVWLPVGVELDLGATAKAHAADLAANAAFCETGSATLVSIGGDIAVAGPAPEGGWSVRIADDHADANGSGPVVAISQGGLATSSVTVRRWNSDRGAMHHVLDPRSGDPTSTCWRTVSAVAATCADANVATTASLVFGESAPEWLERQGIPARLVNHDGSVVGTCGWDVGVTA